MKTETVDIHFGISWLMDMHEVSERIKSTYGTLISGRKYELIHDEGKDNWKVWGKARQSDYEPWHLIIRVEYPDGLSNDIIYRDYEEFEEILGSWMRTLKFEGKHLIAIIAVITDSDDWSAYRGGRARNIAA